LHQETPPVPQPTRNRRTIRLPGYDYTRPGGYYVTIVTHGREPVLGAVTAGSVVLSAPGVIVQKTWRSLPHHFASVRLDEFVVMPNHVHGIILITDDHDGFRRGEALDQSGRGRSGDTIILPAPGLDLPGQTRHSASVQAHSVPSEGRGRSGDGMGESQVSVDLPLRADRGLPEIIRAFKSFSARQINRMQNTPGQPFWQRNYYEHIIRDATELQKIRRYIQSNPLRWELDAENLHTP
jgi:REP element-mobilizing transposase RayT